MLCPMLLALRLDQIIRAAARGRQIGEMMHPPPHAIDKLLRDFVHKISQAGFEPGKLLSGVGECLNHCATNLPMDHAYLTHPISL